MTPIAAWFRSWPLAWRVPVLVALLMVGVAGMISEVVLSRLESDQEANLRELTGAYLDGLAAAVLEPTIRGDVWEVFDALDRAGAHYGGVKARYVLVENPDGRVVAASDPLRFPLRSATPNALADRFRGQDALVIDNAGSRAWLARPLRTEGVTVGRILAEIDLTDMLRVRRNVLLTLILLNGALTAAFAAIGYVALKRMLRPLGVLADHVKRVRDGQVEPIPERAAASSSSEFRHLFEQFNAMAKALDERRQLAARLAKQEEQAVLGRLASAMAHEVNNPLGGLFNELETLRLHGSDDRVRGLSLDLLQRGLTHIRNVVGSTLVLYKREAAKRLVTADDIDDLRVLVQPQAVRRSVSLIWENRIDRELPVNAGSVRQVTLNLLLNACAAAPRGGSVQLRAFADEASLVLEVVDDGPGLPPDLAAYLTSRPSQDGPIGDGLGLWIVKRLVADDGGAIEARSFGDDGPTRIRVRWPLAGKTLPSALPILVEETLDA